MSKCSAYFIVNSLEGKHDAKQIKRELDTLPGVLSVSVNTDSNKIAVDFDSTGVTCNNLENRINKMGFNVTDFSLDQHIM